MKGGGQAGGKERKRGTCLCGRVRDELMEVKVKEGEKGKRVMINKWRCGGWMEV